MGTLNFWTMHSTPLLLTQQRDALSREKLQQTPAPRRRPRGNFTILIDASVHRLPTLDIGLVVLPYSLQFSSVPISDGGYQRHRHAWGPRPRETRECTDVAYPRKCAELNGERSVANPL